jgi:hypothetical protein
MRHQHAAARFTPVEFASEGATLRGRFYLPCAAAGPARRHPLLVMGHGFASTVSMTADRYAEAFAARGLVVLLYDHRNLGASGGEPRREVNPWVQARGYRDAVRFARTSLAEADPERVALWGLSNSGMHVLVLGALLQDESVGEKIPSVTGRWLSTPMSADPAAGVSLLSGVGAGPPPDGV